MRTLIVSDCCWNKDYVRFIFNDNSELLIVPHRENDKIDGIHSVILYQNRKIEAIAFDKPFKYAGFGESLFCSNEKITQERLSEYLDMGLLVGKCFQTEYENKEENEDKVETVDEFFEIIKQGDKQKDILQAGKKIVAKESIEELFKKYKCPVI